METTTSRVMERFYFEGKNRVGPTKTFGIQRKSVLDGGRRRKLVGVEKEVSGVSRMDDDFLSSRL